MSEAHKPRDLKEDCVAEAMAIIASDGVEKLSLREVARRLGVSHQAPYKHFSSRDHILAEVVARAFADFARRLDAAVKTADPEGDMGGMGLAYLDYAHNHPLEYRLMFGTPLPNVDEHPEMMRQAKHAFALLREALRQKARQKGFEKTDDAITLDALFIWSGLHGLSSILTSSVLQTLELNDELLVESRSHLLKRFGQAFETDD